MRQRGRGCASRAGWWGTATDWQQHGILIVQLHFSTTAVETYRRTDFCVRKGAKTNKTQVFPVAVAPPLRCHLRPTPSRCAQTPRCTIIHATSAKSAQLKRKRRDVLRCAHEHAPSEAPPSLLSRPSSEFPTARRTSRRSGGNGRKVERDHVREHRRGKHAFEAGGTTENPTRTAQEPRSGL